MLVLLKLIVLFTLHDLLFQLYSMDISPNYSATIFGFGTAIASLPGFFNALLMDLLIEGTVSVNFITVYYQLSSFT